MKRERLKFLLLFTLNWQKLNSEITSLSIGVMSSKYKFIEIIQLEEYCRRNLRKERGVFPIEEENGKGKRSILSQG